MVYRFFYFSQPCNGITKQGKRCRAFATILYAGKYYCHNHEPIRYTTNKILNGEMK